MDHRVEEWVYGESLADASDAARRNLLGRVVTTRDGAGESSVEHYDPTGNMLSATHRLRADVDTEPDYRAPVPLEADFFATTTAYDALGRAQVRLLGAAQPRDSACQQSAHASVGHDRGPARQPLAETAGHRRRVCACAPLAVPASGRAAPSARLSRPYGRAAC